MASTAARRRSWVVVGSSTFALTLSVNTLVLAPFGIMITPISEDFGWSRSTVTGALSLYALTAALVMPFMGGLLDRYGFRKVVISGALISGVLLSVLSFAPPSIGIWFVLMAILGVTTTPQNGVPYYKLASQWLDGRRGLAMGIIGTGGAIGGALVPQYVGVLLDNFDWQLTFLGLGVLLVIVVVPVAATLLREPRREEIPDLGVRHEGGILPGLSWREAVRTRQFWQLFVVVLLVGSAIPGVIVQMAPLLMDRGATTSQVIGVVSAMGIATLVGRLLGGFLLDRFFAPLVAGFVFAMPIVGFLLIANGGFGLAVVGALLVGAALGGEGDLVSYMTSRYMGVRFFGQIYGIFMAVLALGYSVGPIAFAAVYDATGSYNPALLAFGIGLAASVALVLGIGKYRYPPVDEQVDATDDATDEDDQGVLTAPVA
ncbi:MFS transporter [Geodermatophilus sp. SYSU D00079]